MSILTHYTCTNWISSKKFNSVIFHEINSNTVFFSRNKQYFGKLQPKFSGPTQVKWRDGNIISTYLATDHMYKIILYYNIYYLIQI